jgi:hypothetical protein
MAFSIEEPRAPARGSSPDEEAAWIQTDSLPLSTIEEELKKAPDKALWALRVIPCFYDRNEEGRPHILWYR